MIYCFVLAKLISFPFTFFSSAESLSFGGNVSEEVKKIIADRIADGLTEVATVCPVCNEDGSNDSSNDDKNGGASMTFVLPNPVLGSVAVSVPDMSDGASAAEEEALLQACLRAVDCDADDCEADQRKCLGDKAAVWLPSSAR